MKDSMPQNQGTQSHTTPTINFSTQFELFLRKCSAMVLAAKLLILRFTEANHNIKNFTFMS